jgi:iron complex outermembrane receptor protein
MCFFGFAQQNEVTGTIVTNESKPLSDVSVRIANTSQGTTTNEMGVFVLKNVKKGDIKFIISSIGFKTKETIVTVLNDKQTNIGSIILFEGNELLQEVVIEGTRDNKFNRKETAYVSKLPLKDIDNSQVYTTVTNELLESQIITNFDDALLNATGVSKLWESTGRAPGEGTGYFSVRGFSTQPALVDGMPGFTFSAIDPSYIERIEVIKGPSATLFGSTATSIGGLINVVTKKPYKGFGGNVSYTTGSFGLHRISADINTPLGKGNVPYFRMNASYLTQDSFQDAGGKETFFVAPSLTYSVNSRLNLSFGLEYSRTEQTNPSMLFLRRGMQMPTNNVGDLGIDPEKSFTSDDVTLTSPIFNTRAIADYKLSDNWNSNTVFASTYSQAKGYYQYMIEGASVAFGTLQPLLEIPSPDLMQNVGAVLMESQSLLNQDVFARIYDYRDADATKANFQQNFTGDFKLGSMRNRMVLGLDYVYREQNTRNKTGNPSITQNGAFPAINQNLLDLEGFGLIPVGTAAGLQAQLNNFPYFDGFFSSNGNVVPTSFTPNTTYSTTEQALDNVFNQIPAMNISTRSQTYAAYVSNVLDVTDKLSVNLGLRLDHFDQDGDKSTDQDDYSKTTLSPKAGIVFQPIKDKLTLFGNYQTGFVNVDPVINFDGTVSTFDPQEAIQFEGGVKANFFNGKLSAGVSYYDITVENTTNTDPTQPLFPSTIDIKESTSKGVEIDVNANPISGLNLRASYAYNESEITDAYSSLVNTTFIELEGRRPESAGPESLYNFWADYKFKQTSFLKNFGLGAGFNGASEHLTMNNSVSGVFTLPSYTIYNASAYYDVKKFRVGFKVNNLTDETYYKGWSTVNAQAPMSFLGSFTYKF